MRRLASLFVLASAALPATGCYRYAALPPDAPARDLDVRVSLTAAGTQQVAGEFGPYIRQLNGRLDGEWPSDSLRLRVYATRHESGFRTDFPAGRPIVLPTAAVAGVERRSLDKVRTGLVGAAVATVLVALPRYIQNAGSSGGGGGGGTTPPPQP